jgi:GxxExxY protein
MLEALTCRVTGPGLIESIHQKCEIRELELRGVSVRSQDMVQIQYKDITYAEELRFDLLIAEVDPKNWTAQ